jgi:hypothetical protein
MVAPSLAQDYLQRFRDFLLTGQGLGLRTQEEQQWEYRLLNPSLCRTPQLAAA